jgi:hypothetical protein
VGKPVNRLVVMEAPSHKAYSGGGSWSEMARECGSGWFVEFAKGDFWKTSKATKEFFDWRYHRPELDHVAQGSARGRESRQVRTLRQLQVVTSATFFSNLKRPLNTKVVV